jgi:hypothetical protein
MATFVVPRRIARASACVTAVLVLGVYSACGSSSSNNNGGPGGGDDGGNVNDGTTSLLGGDASACKTAADCNGGACITSSGQCCASAARVCGDTCCASGSVCNFGQCVVAGAPCRTATDCAAGQYCETDLGGGSDGGTATAGDAQCTQPLPILGYCLPLPATCADDAGGDDSGCVESCEYHPPSGGSLTAIPKWTWGPVAQEYPDFTDVWSTPTIARIHDNNCDGKVDELDTPNIVFVSGDSKDDGGVGTCCQCNNETPTACHTGVLRMLDGSTGREIWSLAKASPTSSGFAGFSNALGDVDNDGYVDIVAATGEGLVVLIDRNGNVVRTSDKPIPGFNSGSFGWGGGLSIADMDHDGFAEITFGSTIFTTTGGLITRQVVGDGGTGGVASEETSTLADLDGDGNLDLLAGNTAYRVDGSVLWNNAALPNGFPAVGDFNKDGAPEAVLVANSQLWVLNGATGAIVLGPVTVPGGAGANGGPPTVAAFEGNGVPEIGIASSTFYSVFRPNYTTTTLDLVWKTANHDLSSSVTGSTVFDFEGDGKPEVIYADECFLWVFDGATGAVRFAAPHTSFTATEASLLADVDGDGHAEMVMVSNGANPGPGGWACEYPDGGPETINGSTWVAGPATAKAYRGITVFGDSADSWVGTRTIWSEHTYHVSNICDDTDNACPAPNTYGSIPKTETNNWTIPYLNDFRQNVQDKGIFNAPDAIIALTVDCSSPVIAHVTIGNAGLSGLPAGVKASVLLSPAGTDVVDVTTTSSLLPGQSQTIDVALPATFSSGQTYTATIDVDPVHPTFHECRADNDTSSPATAICTK